MKPHTGLRLVLIRHGHPLSEEAANVSDETLRPLSEHGISSLNQLCQEMDALSISPDLILCSPILRAKESSQVIGTHFSVEPKTDSALSYNFNSDVILNTFTKSPEIHTVFCIGHNPNLSYFGQLLLQEGEVFDGLQPAWALAIDFEKEVDQSKGKIKKLFTPS
jgi:phosphohistidine phosphatase SixA